MVVKVRPISSARLDFINYEISTDSGYRKMIKSTVLLMFAIFEKSMYLDFSMVNDIVKSEKERIRG